MVIVLPSTLAHLARRQLVEQPSSEHPLRRWGVKPTLL
jgi:hypothetical protein